METTLDWAGSRSGHVASCSECGNEHSVDPNCWVCLWLVEELLVSKEWLFSLQLFSVSTEVFTLATPVKIWCCHEFKHSKERLLWMWTYRERTVCVTIVGIRPYVPLLLITGGVWAWNIGCRWGKDVVVKMQREGRTCLCRHVGL